MTDDNTGGTTGEPAVLNADELKDVVGDEVDARMEARGLTTDRLSKLDMLDSLGSTFEDLFTKHSGNTAQFDKEGFLGEISKMIDSKLAALAPSGNGGGNDSGNGKRVGPISRFLTGAGTDRS